MGHARGYCGPRPVIIDAAGELCRGRRSRPHGASGRAAPGLVLETDPLPHRWLDELFEAGSAVEADRHERRPIIILDQVTDPHNVGAVLRSAVAFDALASSPRIAIRRLNPARSPVPHPARWRHCRGYAW